MALAPAEAERLVRDFETAARRQRDACAVAAAQSVGGSGAGGAGEGGRQAVRLRAAERDLLRSAGLVRDLLQRAVQGDKRRLAETFAGESALAARVRAAVAATELSEFNRGSRDFANLLELVEVLEALLVKVAGAGGGLRVWRSPTAAPESLSYVGFPASSPTAPASPSVPASPSAAPSPTVEGGYGEAPPTFEPGQRVDLRPVLLGVGGARAGLRWSVEPSLPAGLVLDNVSGSVTGQLTPGEEVPRRCYTVTCSNDAGLTSCALTFRVLEPAPTSIKYSDVTAECFTGDHIIWQPAVEGGTSLTWVCDPDLPDGMELDVHSGEIVGCALRAAELGRYTVTASNAAGSAATELEFCVRVAPPLALSYPEVLDSLPCGGVVYMTPEVEFKRAAPSAQRAAKWDRRFSGTGAFVGTKWGKVRQMLGHLKRQDVERKLHFSADPRLPPGLALAEATGVISGKPEQEIAAATYVVTVTNDGGSVSSRLRFGVKLEGPRGLQFPEFPETLVTGKYISLEPEVSGIVLEWAVKEPLPKGLAIDPGMGTICGAPVEPVSKATYTVVAKNSKGEAESQITFAVQRQMPQGLEYKGLVMEYAVGCLFDLRPTFEGDVDEFSISPALPTGLALDSRSGIIAGTATSEADEVAYTVVARNESGTCQTTVLFCIHALPPSQLSYPGIDDEYGVGEPVNVEPTLTIGGGGTCGVAALATTWTVDPPLPGGWRLDASTGVIRGAAEAEAEERQYTVVVDNSAGSTSVVISFRIVSRAPEGLSYPEVGMDCSHSVGSFLTFRPRLTQDFGAYFEVDRPLPSGLHLDPVSGVISGTPSAPCSGEDFIITAKNIAGCTDARVHLTIASEDDDRTLVATSAVRGGEEDEDDADDPANVAADELIRALGGFLGAREGWLSQEDLAFAAKLEETFMLEDLPSNPSRKGQKTKQWMLWMVHRAYLNDPSLALIDFSGSPMPLPYEEPRIAPKLMVALVRNTHLTSLLLQGANLRNPQGAQLADALRRNTTLEILNVESNHLDAERILRLTVALLENKDSALVSWRFDCQKDCQFFGGICEEALAMLATNRSRITTLGFQCKDQHWHKLIRSALAANSDSERRARKAKTKHKKQQKTREENKEQRKRLAKVSLASKPESAPWEVFDDGDFDTSVIRRFVAERRVVPTLTQLQSFVREQGIGVAVRKVAKSLRDFRGALFSAYINRQVVLTEDEVTKPYLGVLQRWSEKNDRYEFDLRLCVGGQKVTFEAACRPAIEVSEEVAQWVEPEEKRLAADGAAYTLEEFAVLCGGDRAEARRRWAEAAAIW